jgi:hypothetical protein
MVAQPDMPLDAIRQLRLANPFRQFYVVLRDGRRLFVDEPYHVGIAPDGSHLMVCPGGAQINHLAPEDVVQVEVRSDQVA